MAEKKKVPITQVGQAEDKKKALEAALAQPIHTENLINAWNAFVSLF